jgi:hypothetical protein
MSWWHQISGSGGGNAFASASQIAKMLPSGSSTTAYHATLGTAFGWRGLDLEVVDPRCFGDLPPEQLFVECRELGWLLCLDFKVGHWSGHRFGCLSSSSARMGTPFAQASTPIETQSCKC